MNKLFTKVAALTLGVAMAAGVGVALGSANVHEAKATSYSATLGKGQNAYDDNTINGKYSIKAGTSSKQGSATITIPSASAQKLTFYAAAWNNDAKQVNLTATGVTLSVSSLTLTNDSALSGTGSTWTLAQDEQTYFFELSLTDCTANAVVTLTANTASKNRFFVWDAQYDDGEAGEIVDVTGVSLDQNQANLVIPNTVKLTATIAPENATNKIVTWQSSDPSVATVANGVVKAVDVGTATITVTTQDGSFTDSCTVTVDLPDIQAAKVAEAIEIGAALADGATSTEYYRVTGYVVAITYPYAAGTMSFTMAETEGGTDTVTVYKFACSEEEAAKVIVNSRIRVVGNIQNYVKSNVHTYEIVNNIKSQSRFYDDKVDVTFAEYQGGSVGHYDLNTEITIPGLAYPAPEGKELDYWEHKETGDHYAPGDKYTVTGSAYFTAVYKDIVTPVTDWTEDQQTTFSGKLDGYVPPFLGELVGDLNVGENSVDFTVSGDITANFATKLGNDWTDGGEGYYTLETLNGSIMAYASLSGNNTYVIFQFNAAPVQTDWSDTFKATWNERFVSGDSQIAALPPFLGAELSSDANVSWHTSYPYADIDVVDGTDLAIFNAIDDALYNSADWQYVGKLEQGVGYVYVEKTLTAYAVVYAYQATETEIHSGVTFEVVGSISADTTNAKLEYFVGDTIDISGVVVHFALLDGTWIHSAPFVVPIDYCTPDVTTFDAAGTVTVTLDVAGVYTVKYQVTVTAVSLTSLEVSGTPSVAEYKAGEEWNPEGLVVTATYNNGTTADVTNQVTWTFDPAETTKEVESVSVTASLGDVTSAPFAYAVSVSDGYDANQFARDLLDAVAPICANYDGKTNNKLALRTVWETMSQRYASLSGEEKAKVIEASAKVDGTDLEKAMAFYNYACKKYGLTKFIEGRQVNALVSTQETSSSILPIIVIVASSIAAVTAIGVVIGLKRRKSFITK